MYGITGAFVLGFTGTFSHKCCSRRFLCSSVLETFRKEVKDLQNEIISSNADLQIKNKRVTYSMKHYEAISQYLDSKLCLKNIKSKIPNHYLLRKYSSPNMLHLIDKDVADKIMNAIKPYLVKDDKGYILEVNSGYGLLTSKLVNAKFPRLCIYEADSALHKDLHIFLLRQGSDAKLFKSNLLTLWPPAKKGEDAKTQKLFSDIPKLSWEDDPAMKIILTISSEKLIAYIIYCITHQMDLFNYGRFELFVVMPPTVYHKYTSLPQDGYLNYRIRSVLFQILFDHKLLAKLPEKAFVPWMTKGKNEILPIDKNMYYLVKITARKDLLQNVPPHLLRPLRFFIHSLMFKRKGRVLPKFEKWVPGSGVRLISQGYTIFTECGTLKPEQFLKLFVEFTQWPEFKSSSFLPSMESLQQKLNDRRSIISSKIQEKKRQLENLSMYEFEDDDSIDSVYNEQEKERDKENEER